MPRARQMPRTRRLRTWRAVTGYTAVALLAAGVAVVRAAGSDWLIALVVLIGFGALIVLGVRVVFGRIDRARPGALAADVADLSPEQRQLPYGVEKDDDGAICLPSKSGLVWVVWALAVLLLAGGVWVAIGVTAPGGRAFGGFLALVGIWLALCGYWITGVRIRLTEEGVESRMGPRRFYTWMQVPEIKVDRLIIILKAAGARRPRVWIRTGLLEASFNDCRSMIRKQRGW